MQKVENDERLLSEPSNNTAALSKLKRARPLKCVLLGDLENSLFPVCRGLLNASKRMQVQLQLHWIASDGWGKQQKLVESLEEVAEGAITVELQSEHMPGFDEYMMSLTPENNLRNPWFDEYWQVGSTREYYL